MKRLSIDEILSELTDAQKEAVTTICGPLLILAGAGSGKTRVITHRTAYLIETGVKGHKILALTFTNKAANEMKSRVRNLLGFGKGRNDFMEPFVSTFHSFCLWVLRRFADRIGYSLDFTVIDETDQLGIIKEILREENIDERRFSPKHIQNLISEAKIRMVPFESYFSNSTFAEIFINVASKYKSFLKKNNLMDFDDLLINTLSLLNEDTLCSDFLKERFSHVMIDEYQDTNRIQYLIAKKISEDHRNLCAVGDDDQSIYSWRGADIRNILDFERDFPEAKIIKLEENFRSTSIILDVAWNVIKNNELRREKRLYTKKRSGEAVKLYVAESEKDEALFVVNEIEKLTDKYDSFAVFYRTGAQSRPFEEELNKKDIPYTVVGGIRFYERKEIKDAVAYLKFIRNPNDFLSFKRIVNVPPRGIGVRTVEKIANYMENTQYPLWEALNVIIETGNLFKGAILIRLKNFVDLIKELSELKDELPLSLFLEEVLNRTGYIRMLEEENTHESLGRLENLKELVSVASDYDDIDNALDAFLDRVALSSPVDELKEEVKVSLMTLHSAKGLEFDVVFMVGMEEGFLPHFHSMNNPIEIEEERRLCYVGITRAKELLYFTRASERRYFGRIKSFPPSRFLLEIPQHLIEIVKADTPVAKSFHNTQYLKTHPSEPEHNYGFSKGDTVIHPKFGQGKVLAVSGKGDNLKLKVRFYKYGIKLLAAKFANLRKGD